MQQIKTEYVFDDEDVSDEEKAYLWAKFFEIIEDMANNPKPKQI